MERVVYFGQNGNRGVGKLRVVKEQGRSYVEARSKFHDHTRTLSAIRHSPHSSSYLVEPRNRCCDLIPYPKVRFPVTHEGEQGFFLKKNCIKLT